MRQDFLTFQPRFKLMIVGNHKPAIVNVDDAMRRRFNIVPFTVKPATPDPMLEENLRKEFPSILRWMIDGCLDWQANGLMPPTSVSAATADFQRAGPIRAMVDGGVPRRAPLEFRLEVTRART